MTIIQGSISRINHAYLNIFHVRIDFLKLAEFLPNLLRLAVHDLKNSTINVIIEYSETFSFNRNILFDFTIFVKYRRKYSREHFQLLTLKIACGPILLETRLTGNLVAFSIHVPLFLRYLTKKERDVSSMITIQLLLLKK